MAEDSLLKFVLAEVRHQIPRTILDRAGGQPFTDLMVTTHLAEVRRKTLKNIPASWREKVVRYVISRLKHGIFQKHKESEKTWVPADSLLLEQMAVYADAGLIADDVMNTIIQIDNMRKSASRQGIINVLVKA